MGIRYSEVEDVLEFVASGSPGQNCACTNTRGEE
jgi:hypothetical protein